MNYCWQHTAFGKTKAMIMTVSVTFSVTDIRHSVSKNQFQKDKTHYMCFKYNAYLCICGIYSVLYVCCLVANCFAFKLQSDCTNSPNSTGLFVPLPDLQNSSSESDIKITQTNVQTKDTVSQHNSF